MRNNVFIDGYSYSVKAVFHMIKYLFLVVTGRGILLLALAGGV